MLIMQQPKLHSSHTPFEPKQTVYNFLIKLYAARANPPFSKLSDAATSKGAQTWQPTV